MTSKDGRIPLNVAELKQLRKRLGYSQDKLAEACFDRGFTVSISSIKRAEAGANVLYRTAKNLAEFYGVAVETLLLSSSLPYSEASHPDSSGTTQESARTSAANLSRNHASRRFQLDVQHQHWLDPKLVYALLDGIQTINSHVGTTLILQWPISDQTEFIFEQIRDRCDTLLRTFPAQLKLCLTCVETSDTTSFDHLFDQIDWGQTLACPVFISSDCFNPIDSHRSPHANSHQRVSVARVERNDFVGRHEEKRLLENAINQLVIQQQGMAICLSGMAGIGKTRLLTESIRHANSMSCQVSQLQLLNRGIVDVHAPVNALVRALYEFDTEDDDHFIRQQMVLSTVPSEYHLVLFWLMGLELHPTEKRLLELMDFQTLQTSISESIHHLMRIRPIFPPRIICVEDVHWADDTLLTAMTAMLPDIHASNILLLMTFRQQNHFTEPQSWFQQVQLIELSMLSEDEAQQLARQFYAPQPNLQNQTTTQPAKNQELIDHCLNIAKGHPLYLRQSLLCAQTKRQVPDSMEHLVAAQLSQLSDSDCHAIQVASVLGQCFQLEQIRAITENPGFVPDHLLALGLIKRQGNQFMFHHDLICSAVLHQIPTTTLKTMHQRCALWFSDKDPYEYAVHYQHAGSPDAAQVMLNTAQQLMDNFQQQKALSLLESLQTPDMAHTASREQKAQALNLQGLCLFAMGKIDDSIPAFEAAIKKALGHSTSAYSDPDLAKYLLDLATPYRMTDRNQEAMKVLDNAQTVAEQHHQLALLADIHSMRGNMLFPTGDLEGCEREHQQSLTYAERLKDPAAMARARAKSLGGLGDCAYAQAKMTSAYRYLQDCLDLCTEHQLLKTEASNRFMLGTVLIYQLKFHEALQELQLATNLAHLTANRRAEIVSRLTTGWILLDLGALSKAEQEIDTAIDLAEQLQASRFVAFLLESKARLFWQQGKLAEAEQAITRGLALVTENGMERFIGPWLCATQALVSKSENTVTSALEQGETWLKEQCVGHNYLRFYQQGLQVAWRLQDSERIERYRNGLHEFTRAEPNPWADLYMEQADLMLSLINQTAMAHELFQFNQKVENMGMETGKVDVSAISKHAAH